MKTLDNFSKYHIDEHGNVFNSKFNKKLKPYQNVQTGYYMVSLSDNNNKIHKVTVHRLVAKAYIPNLNNLPQVNHKDGNKLNNNADNLEWSTNQQNQQHAYDLNLVPKLDQRYNNVNPVESIHAVCSLLEEGLLSSTEISQQTGVHPKTVGQIKYRKQWKDISNLYVW